MTTQEFSNAFDTLLNSYNNQAMFGETSSRADIALDEYEKSIFLTQAQDLIIKQYFERTSANLGFDENERRQIDFSSLIRVASPDRYVENTSEWTVATGYAGNMPFSIQGTGKAYQYLKLNINFLPKNAAQTTPVEKIHYMGGIIINANIPFGVAPSTFYNTNSNAFTIDLSENGSSPGGGDDPNNPNDPNNPSEDTIAGIVNSELTYSDLNDAKVKLSVGGHGTVTKKADKEYEKEDETVYGYLTVVPDEGYKVSSVCFIFKDNQEFYYPIEGDSEFFTEDGIKYPIGEIETVIVDFEPQLPENVQYFQPAYSANGRIFIDHYEPYASGMGMPEGSVLAYIVAVPKEEGKVISELQYYLGANPTKEGTCTYQDSTGFYYLGLLPNRGPYKFDMILTNGSTRSLNNPMLRTATDTIRITNSYSEGNNNYATIFSVTTPIGADDLRSETITYSLTSNRGAGSSYDERGILYKLPTTQGGNPSILFVLNEKLLVTKRDNSLSPNGNINVTKTYVVKPISYREYDREMSKAYSQPLKKQCWRLFQNSTGIDIVSEIIPTVGTTINTTFEYRIRYVERPTPIVLTTLPEDLEIDGYRDVTECSLNPVLHMDILNKAVELVLSTRAGRSAQAQHNAATKPQE